MPGSVAIATNAAASAASTAFPPSAATPSPASSAWRPVAATATFTGPTLPPQRRAGNWPGSLVSDVTSCSMREGVRHTRRL